MLDAFDDLNKLVFVYVFYSLEQLVRAVRNSLEPCGSTTLVPLTPALFLFVPQTHCSASDILNDPIS